MDVKPRYVGLIATGVQRSLDQWTEPVLHRSAYAAGASFRHRFAGQNYQLAAQLTASRVAGTPQAILYMAFSVPRRAYTLFPYAAVVGALMALGQLAASSELTALRALGLSRRRLSLAVAGALALLTALMVLSGETAGPWGDRRANALKASAKSKDMIVARYSGLWAREGDVILNANGGEERDNGSDRWLELRDVRLYEFQEDGRLKSLALVKIAEHRPGGWLLRDVVRTNFQEKSVTQTKVKEERWASKLDAVAIRDAYDALSQTSEPFARRIMDEALRETVGGRTLEDL